MAEENCAEYELVFHGPIDYSEEGIAHLKKVMSESFGLSPYAVDLFFEKAPFPIKKAKSSEELESYMQSLREAGGDVSIRHPDDEPITKVHIVDPRKKRGSKAKESAVESSDDNAHVVTFNFEELLDGEFSECIAEAEEALESLSDTKAPKGKESEETKPKEKDFSTPSFELEDTGPELFGNKDITPKSAIVLEAKNKSERSNEFLALEVEESAPAKPDNSKIELIAKLRRKGDTATFKREELATPASEAPQSVSSAPASPTAPPSPIVPPASFDLSLDSLDEPAPKKDPPREEKKESASIPALDVGAFSLNLNDDAAPHAETPPVPPASAALASPPAPEQKSPPPSEMMGLGLNLSMDETGSSPPPAIESKNDAYELNLTALKQETPAPESEAKPAEIPALGEVKADSNPQDITAKSIPEAEISPNNSVLMSITPEQVPVIEAPKLSAKSIFKQSAAPVALCIGLILLLGGMNWFYFSSKSQRELSALAVQLFNSPIFAAFQEHALELVVARKRTKPPEIRYWKGQMKNLQSEAEMTFSTSDDKVTTAELIIQIAEPPSLTPEQIVRNEKGIPWMRRITASAFLWKFTEDGEFTATAPARLSIEWGQKMHRSIANVELHGKVDLTNMIISTDITIRGNIEDPTGLPLVFIEPLPAASQEEEGRFRVYVSTQVESKFMNSLDLEAISKAREAKEKALADKKKKDEPKNEDQNEQKKKEGDE